MAKYTEQQLAYIRAWEQEQGNRARASAEAEGRQEFFDDEVPF